MLSYGYFARYYCIALNSSAVSRRLLAASRPQEDRHQALSIVRLESQPAVFCSHPFTGHVWNLPASTKASPRPLRRSDRAGRLPSRLRPGGERSSVRYDWHGSDVTQFLQRVWVDSRLKRRWRRQIGWLLSSSRWSVVSARLPLLAGRSRGKSTLAD